MLKILMLRLFLGERLQPVFFGQGRLLPDIVAELRSIASNPPASRSFKSAWRA